MTFGEVRTKVQREPRRELHGHAASLTADDGMTMRECVILDVSPGGAKILTEAEINVSDRFGLSPVPGQQKLRPCEVIWRRGRIYGVKFLL